MFQTEESSVASASSGYKPPKEKENPTFSDEYQSLSGALSGLPKSERCLGTRVWSINWSQEFCFQDEVPVQRHQGGTTPLSGCVYVSQSTELCLANGTK